jgi:CRISPR-associated protein Cas1
MIKQALFIDNPAYLSLKFGQLVVSRKNEQATLQRSIEDLGFLILNNPQINFSMGLMNELIAQNVSVIFCDRQHMPAGMLLPLDVHHTQSAHFQAQLDASVPQKKQLWQQIIKAKIKNQAGVLDQIGKSGSGLQSLVKDVKSGDSTNLEARASRYYWPQLFGDDFLRRRFGQPPNTHLNYGYAILRAAVSRALTGAGLFPAFGIHHSNKYNAFCLSDDMMEPYRAYVDFYVWEMWVSGTITSDVSTSEKLELLKVLTCDVQMGSNIRPLMNAVSETATSLVKCYLGKSKKLSLPKL